MCNSFAMEQQPARAITWNRRTWTAIGVVLLVIGLVYASSQVSIIITPFILALFPAALLDPLAARLRDTRIPNVLVALIMVILLIAVLAGILAFITVALINQLPQIAGSVVSGLQQLEQAINWTEFPADIQGLSDLASQGASALASSGLIGQGATLVGNFLTGLVLMVVVLFFFFKDGRRIWRAFLEFVPRRHQPRINLLGEQSFWTIGAYFRAQLLVALVDAVFIGLGLWLLDVPLVLPLSVLVFIGGLFPIVGAFVSGFVAVLVALADQGLVTALLALGVVLLVQQIEGNVLEPLIQGRVIALHPLLIILSVTAGGLILGVLGAFLAVPIAAVIARIIDNIRGRPFPSGPGSKEDLEESDEDESRRAEPGEGVGATAAG